MDDDALWYGPAEGQFLQGRETMIATWQAEDHPLRFTMGNLKVRHASAHPSFCDVMLTYTVVTHYPDGHDLSVFQRMLLCWCERKVTDGNGETEVMATVASLEKRYAHLFLRCHQSYLVNPHFLRNIRRFQVTLTDGTTLPIPEKKYTAFKSAVMRALNH